MDLVLQAARRDIQRTYGWPGLFLEALKGLVIS